MRPYLLYIYIALSVCLFVCLFVCLSVCLICITTLDEVARMLNLLNDTIPEASDLSCLFVLFSSLTVLLC